MPNFGYISADILADLEAEYGIEEEESATSPNDWWDYWQDEY